MNYDTSKNSTYYQVFADFPALQAVILVDEKGAEQTIFCSAPLRYAQALLPDFNIPCGWNLFLDFLLREVDSQDTVLHCSANLLGINVFRKGETLAE